jgi:tetratricopeptide (TPR) repeat protein
VATRLGTADVIVAEGVKRGASRRATILVFALTLTYRLLTLNRGAGLVEQDIDYSRFDAAVINPDVTADEFQGAWQRIPWTFRLMAFCVVPVVVLGELIGGRRAIWSAAMEVNDLPSLDDELFSESAPEFEQALLGDRDARLLAELVRVHEERGDEEIEVAIVYGAGHVPAIVHGLRARLGYVARAGDWLTVAHLDPEVAEVNTHPRPARPPRPRGSASATVARPVAKATPSTNAGPSAKATPPAPADPTVAHRRSGLDAQPDPVTIAQRVRQAEAAVTRLRPLAKEHPEGYQARLVRALATYSDHLAGSGSTDDAVAAADEAVDVAEAMREQHGGTYDQLYASSLTTLARRVSGVGRHAQAAALVAEAIEIRRASDRPEPQQRASALGPLLDEHARLLLLDGRPDAAVAPASEAVDLYREAGADGTGDWDRARALALARLSRAQLRAGRADQATDAAQRAVNVVRRIAARDTQEGALLVECLRQLAHALAVAGQHAQAIVVAQEAVEVARGHLPSLAVDLANYATSLDAVGRTEEAQLAREEAHRHSPPATTGVDPRVEPESTMDPSVTRE